MAAYAVNARIERVAPHLVRHGRAAAGAWPQVEPLEGEPAIDLVGRPLVPGLARRWATVRDAWVQTTFYLFDPEGWR